MSTPKRQTPDLTSLGAPSPLGNRRQLDEYNYEHFRPKHLLADLWKTIRGEGLQPGSEAPDFEMETAEGEQVRLSELRGQPVVLRFGSFTWPLTTGAVAPWKQLYERYGDRVEFLDVLIRQAHPGEERPPYRSYEEKLESAREYKREEGIPWTVLVDDLSGKAHRAYSREMTDPVFLIDSDGRVAFYLMWAHAPTLKKVIDELLEQGGRGVVAGGIDRMVHLFVSFVNGYHGLRGGGKRAVREYNTGAFGAGVLTFLGSKAKPLLAPLALRAEPLPAGARLALLGGLGATAVLSVWSLRRRS